MQEPIDSISEAIDNTFSPRGCLFMYRVTEEDRDIVIRRQDLVLGQLAETPDMYMHEENAFERAYALKDQTGKQIMRTYP